MNTNVVVRHLADPPLLKVWDHPDADDFMLFTRIWMGIVGPQEREPGYAVVVGEVYDGDVRQKARRKIVLDEGQALDPQDFDEETRKKHYDLLYCDLEGEDGQLQQVRKVDLPTLDDLRAAMVTLKDLYHVNLGYTPPNSAVFYQHMRSTEGLTHYSPDYDDGQLAHWYPCFRHSDATATLSDNPPFGDDEEYGRQLIESLLARDELHVNEQCRLFRNRSLTAPIRAVGLVCSAMQVMDWPHQIREWREQDGSGAHRGDKSEEQMVREAQAREIEARLWHAGMPVVPPRDYILSMEHAPLWN